MKKIGKKLNTYWFLLRFYLYIIVFLVPRIPYYRHLEKKGKRDIVVEKAFRVVQKWADYSVKIGKSTITVKGLEKIPQNEPVLFLSNHESYADIPILIHALRTADFGFMLKSTIAEIPFIKNYLEYMSCVTVNQSDIRQAARALREAEAVLNSGSSLLIFPEGKRTFSNSPADFKNGAFKIVAKTRVKVVPICLHNVHLVYEGNEHCIGPADITVTVLDPIETADLTKAEISALSDRVKGAICDELKNFMQSD